MVLPPTPGRPAHDVLVVGARTAGLATALLLARRSHRVLVLDDLRRATGVAPAVLTRAGVVLLARWGLLDAVCATSAPPVRHLTFRFAEEVVRMSVKPSFGTDALSAPPVTDLEAALRVAALAAGVDVVPVVALDDVVREGGRVVGVRAVSFAGPVDEHRATLVVGADGTSSPFADAVGSRTTRESRRGPTLAVGAWSGLPVDGFEWSFGHHLRTGIVPTAPGEACVMVSGTRHRVGAGDAEAIRGLAVAGAPSLARRFAVAVPLRSTHAWADAPARVRESHGPGWALVGAAGYRKDPTSPHGCTDGLRDAELLARAVGHDLGQPVEVDRAVERYAATRDRIGLPVLDVVERLATERHPPAGVAGLLRQLSSAMADEVELLTAPEGRDEH